jgi:tRNA pseudouridine55 synthase
MNFDFFAGEIISVNKPLRITSFQAVNKIKWAARKYLAKYPQLVPDIKAKLKVGHAGTLDPLASGVLIICTGKKTKSITEIQNTEKEYTGTFFIGATTPCYDREREVDANYPIEHIDEKLINSAANKFVGEIMQEPPVFSAVKIKGERAYELARKGLDVQVEAKKIIIKEFEITKIELPMVDFRVVCSKGTYIRSLAYDFGRALNSGAYLHDLCRTRVGDFTLDKSWDLDKLINTLVNID